MKTKNSQNHLLEGRNKYGIATIGKKTKNKSKIQTTSPPECGCGIKKHNMYIYAQWQVTEAKMQSQV